MIETLFSFVISLFVAFLTYIVFSKWNLSQSLKQCVGGHSECEADHPRNCKVDCQGKPQETSKTEFEDYTSKEIGHEKTDTVGSIQYLAGSLKALNFPISTIAVDPLQQYIFVSSTDYVLRLYTLPDISQPDFTLKKIPFIQNKLMSDILIRTDFSHTSEYVFAGTEYSGKLVKLHIEHKPNSSSLSLRLVKESEEMVFGHDRLRWLYSSVGPWILTASEEKNTEIKLYNYQLCLLKTLDTKQIRNYQLDISKQGFFGCAAWVAGIKIERVITQSDQYLKSEKVMDVSTPCGTTALAFSPDNKRLVVASKSGHLLLYTVDVRYKAGEDPHLILDIIPSLPSTVTWLNQLAYSFDGKYLVAVHGPGLFFFDANTLQLLVSLPNAHTSPITHLVPLPSSAYVLSVAANDRAPCLWAFPL